MSTRLEKAVEDLESRLGNLAQTSIAAFFAFCGERLLPLYQEFAQREGWGDPSLLRKALDSAWGRLEGESVPRVKRSDLERITPHSDDFDSPDSTFAQDSIICVDAALVALSARWKKAPPVVYFAIEPVQVAVCQEETGFEQLGTGPKADAWENAAVDHPKLKADLTIYSNVLQSLESKAELSKQDISELRELARNTKWTREKLLP